MSEATVAVYVQAEIEGLTLKLSSQGRSLGTIDVQAEAETLLGRPLTEEERADLVTRLGQTSWREVCARISARIDEAVEDYERGLPSGGER